MKGWESLKVRLGKTSWKQDVEVLMWLMKTISDCSRALRELLRKGVTSRRAKQSHERPEGRCVVCPHSQSEIVKNRCLLSKIKEVEVNSKSRQGSGSGLWLRMALFFLILLRHCSPRLVHYWAGPNKLLHVISMKGCCWTTQRHRDSWPQEEKNSIQGQRWAFV